MDFGAAGGVQPNNVVGGGNANVDLMSWYVSSSSSHLAFAYQILGNR